MGWGGALGNHQGGAATSPLCDSVCGEGAQRGDCAAALLLGVCLAALTPTGVFNQRF